MSVYLVSHLKNVSPLVSQDKIKYALLVPNWEGVLNKPSQEYESDQGPVKIRAHQ
jgi:hypothetical protein